MRCADKRRGDRAPALRAQGIGRERARRRRAIDRDPRRAASLDHAFQVADDGIGIAAADLELALERHATSKIATLEDLDRLDSLGFRGEALPSIAAVSRLRITSRAREAEAAAFLAREGGRGRASGARRRARPGRRSRSRDLFFNTPARRKFLNSPAGELRAALRMLECYALAFPDVAVPARASTARSVSTLGRRRRDDIPRERGRARIVWGARHAGAVDRGRGRARRHRLAALLGLPEHARATREGQVFLVNRRWIQSPMLGQALRQAYGNLLPDGRFPAARLWLAVPPDAARRQRAPDQARGPLRRRGRGVLAGRGRVREAARASAPAVHGGARRPRPSRAGPTRAREAGRRTRPISASGLPTPAPRRCSDLARRPAAGPRRRAPPASEPELWQLHRTYILAPVRGGLVIIDQHAAHERILYEEARARLEGERGASQQLLFPALVDLSQQPVRAAARAGSLAPAARLGPGAARPADRRDPRRARRISSTSSRGSCCRTCSTASARARGAERRTRTSPSTWRARTPATPRCAPAIRSTQAEMRALVDRLFATSRPHGDPHGRVTFVRLDLDELHRRFGRREAVAARAGADAADDEDAAIVAIVGATATGKTALGEALAERLDGEVVCADSRQVFRELEIGTGKPTPAERRRVPHHLFDAAGPRRARERGLVRARRGARSCREIHARGRDADARRRLRPLPARRSSRASPPSRRMTPSCARALAAELDAAGAAGAARCAFARDRSGDRGARSTPATPTHPPRARSAGGERPAAVVVAPPAGGDRRSPARGGRSSSSHRAARAGERDRGTHRARCSTSGLIEETRRCSTRGPRRRRCARCARSATTRRST